MYQQAFVPNRDCVGSDLRTLAERRQLGAFYTPEKLSQILSDWAIRSVDDRVLEPSFGGCGFLEAAANALRSVGCDEPTNQIFGCDIDPVAFTYLKAVFGDDTDLNGFLFGDFLECFAPAEWPESFSVVLANPPYIPHHRIGKARVKELSNREQPIASMGGRSSLWAYFISHSVGMLEPGARMAWVLPGAFLQADYAGPIRSYLAEHFDRVVAFVVRDRLFLSEGTDEETVILLAEGFSKDAGHGVLELGEAETLQELQDLIESWSCGNWAGKSMVASPAILSMSAASIDRFDALADSSICQPLGKFADVRIGLVTGANDFFVLDDASREAAGLQRSDCFPILSKFRAAPGIALTAHDLACYASSGGRSWLVSAGEIPHSHRVAAYLQSFDQARKASNSTFRKRSCWSQPIDGNMPDAFIPVMHHTGPRLVLNNYRCHCTNTIHRVFFQQNVTEVVQKQIAVSLLSSFSQVSAELVGRRYGSGVLKHEPRDAERILLLMPTSMQSDVERAYEEIDGLLRQGHPDRARAVADHFVLSALPVEQANSTAIELSAALTDMRQRRRPRRG